MDAAATKFAYQVRGWPPNMRPELRKWSNISDGAVFSTGKLACQYVHERRIGMAEVLRIPAEGRDDIDYYITQGIWTPTA